MIRIPVSILSASCLLTACSGPAARTEAQKTADALRGGGQWPSKDDSADNMMVFVMKRWAK